MFLEVHHVAFVCRVTHIRIPFSPRFYERHEGHTTFPTVFGDLRSTKLRIPHKVTSTNVGRVAALVSAVVAQAGGMDYRWSPTLGPSLTNSQVMGREPLLQRDDVSVSPS